jgi:hypothetical protein
LFTQVLSGHSSIGTQILFYSALLSPASIYLVTRILNNSQPNKSGEQLAEGMAQSESFGAAFGLAQDCLNNGEQAQRARRTIPQAEGRGLFERLPCLQLAVPLGDLMSS